VIDHYENPRNVGSLNAKSRNVGTGLVGAPACFVGDTIIATADGKRKIKLKDITEDIPVWSYNIREKKFEIRLARSISSGEKPVWKVTFNDGSFAICTDDHKFLMRPNFEYKENSAITKMQQIASFRGDINKGGVQRVELFGEYYVVSREYIGKKPTYTLQVEQNNNYIVLTNFTKNTQTGIIVKNCGDVLRLQIEVDDEGKIVDTKFKTFGCGSAIACSSLGTEWIKGRSLHAATEIKDMDLYNHLKLPPVKAHCAKLMEDAIGCAIDDYKNKQES
jgi:NifU-like protein involved in Fe-S cluster formation